VIGRKCHLLVRAEDFPISLAVTAASVRDRAGSKEILMETGPDLPRLRFLWADAGYNGAPFAE
jgi:putative transposase